MDNWIDRHIVVNTGQDQTFNILNQKTFTLNQKYPTLKFDVKASTSTPGHLSTKGVAVYPEGTERTNPQVLYSYYYPGILTGRVYVIDLGNRFAVVTESISFDDLLLEEEMDIGLANKASFLLSEKTHVDTYNAILQSFQSFTPTKN